MFGDAEEDPFLQDLFQILPAAFQRRGVGVDSGETWNLAVVASVVGKPGQYLLTLLSCSDMLAP